MYKTGEIILTDICIEKLKIYLDPSKIKALIGKETQTEKDGNDR